MDVPSDSTKLNTHKSTMSLIWGFLLHTRWFIKRIFSVGYQSYPETTKWILFQKIQRQQKHFGQKQGHENKLLGPFFTLGAKNQLGEPFIRATKLTQKRLPWRAVSEGGGFWRKKEKLGKNSSSCMLMLEKRGKRISFAACPQRPLWNHIISKVSFKCPSYARHYNPISII